MRELQARELRTALVDVFSHPIDEPLADEAFNQLALRIFAFQYAHNIPYARFCDRRDRTPRDVTHWTEIPAVPTAAFKEVALTTADPAAAEATFRTSGTTQGGEKRGVHYVPDLSIYHFSLIPNFAACLLPDGAELRILSLVPSTAELPDSSLSHMVAVVLERLGRDDSAYCASAARGIDDDRFRDALVAAQQEGERVCILGTSFAFVHWLDRATARAERYALPAGSRLMDTGGYKGRSREVAEHTLRQMYQDVFGIDAAYCINEYGMTEMCSQFYDTSLRDVVKKRQRERRKLVPPWVRTRVVDPETLEPLPQGSTGLLQHFDLANIGSVMAIQTEDLASAVDGGFRLHGRAAGATPRGCSIAMDMLLEAVDARRR